MLSSKDKSDYVHKIFSSIAKRYDLVNSLLSLGIERSWRKFAVKISNVDENSQVLDVCTGTGKLAAAYVSAIGSGAEVLGSDFCFEMLKVGSARGHNFIPIEADTLNLPFLENSFDVVSVGFGIRNVSDLEGGIREMTRVAVKGGRVVILEFTQPTVPLLQYIYYSYFKYLLPTIGNLITGSRDDAYGYLPRSVMEFPNCNELRKIMEKCGLENVQFYRRTFGIVAIHVGVKK